MKIRCGIAILLMAFVLSSCTYKDLCYNHSEHALRHRINIIADYRQDWEEDNTFEWETNWPMEFLPYESLRPALPAGLRVITYADGTNHNINNLPANGDIISLYEGPNDLLMYNNDTEYIVFTDIENSATTRATTRTRTRASFSAQEDENTVGPPDMLYGFHIKDYVPKLSSKPEDLNVTLQPLVFTYKIRYEISEGLEYVTLARGALSGMARSVHMPTGKTSAEAATILFDCEMTDYGARALTNSFGIPNYPNSNYVSPAAEEESNILTLEIKLTNGKLASYNFDVTDQIKAQPHGGVIEVKDIVVDREDAVTSGGFSVDIDGWGDYEDIVLPFI